MAKQVVGFEIVIDGLGRTIETATELKRAIAFVNEEIKKTSDVQQLKKLEAKLIDLKAAQMEVNKVVREQIKTRNEEITATDKINGAYRKLSKELNDQRNRYKDLAAAEQDTSQEARDLLVSINALDKKLKGIDATVGQFQRNVGGYTQALSQFFPRLGGTIGDVTGLVGDLSSGFANLGKTTGIANIGLGTVGLALTAFSGISAIIDQISQSARAIFDLKLQLENFGVAAENLDQVAVRAQTIGEIFKVSSDEVAVAANTLVKEFGLPFEKAFDTIQAGFLKGANAQGEFLKELKEYPAQFRAANLSVEEFLAVSIDAANKGIYDDKALDAVKEFGLSVREQLKGTRDAFIAAFGEEFTNQLFNNLNKGAISSGEALKLVTKEVENTGVSGKELQGLISTVFRAAGEDAGAYVLSLGEVLNNTDNLFVAETDLQKQLERNIKVTQNLNEETAKYSQTVIDAEISRKEFLNGLKSIALFIGDTFIGILNSVALSFSELFGINDEFVKRIKAQNDRASQEDFERLVAQGVLKRTETKKQNDDILKVGSEAWKKQEQQLEKQRESDANKAKKAAKDLNQDLLKNDESKKVGKQVAKAFVDGSLAKLQEEQSKLQKAFGEAVVGSGTQKEIGVKLTAVNEEIKKSIEIQNEILGLNAEKKKQDAINEINQNFKVAQSVINLARAKENTTEDEIEKITKRRKILDEDYNAEIKRINDLLALEKEGTRDYDNLIVERQNAETNYITAKQNLSKEEVNIYRKTFDEIEKETQDNIKKQKEADDKLKELDEEKIKTKKENTQKLIDAIGQSILSVTDIISTFQQARAEKEAQAINEQITNTENNIAELEAKAEAASGLRKKRIEKDIAAQKLLLKQQQDEAEAIRLKAAKQDKKIALLQAIIQGALAIQRALASVPFPANLAAAIPTGIATAAQIATIAAQPLAEGGVVTGQRVNQKQNIPTRSNGDNVLAFVKRGEVVLNQRQQALLGGSPTFRKLGIKGFADGGLVPPISAPATITNATKGVDNLIAVLDAKTDAINSRIDRLQAYVVSDDIARDLAEGNKLKVNATL